ncbi:MULTISPECIES: NnrS family protein [unclassified Rhodanobacter]|uniref:NnrS family protein n=1 Tax=unclassified Rhodanobacter TaxID=2621553 RepID=UPI00098469CC|nr:MULTISPECIES: NnrS family protein [unclassified Rhodanobacter]OOG38538.1 short-chain dehydrogenase [Rhodanobacter sp. C05]OOG50124.1 short-chain dehydrogenase [Rhodanobacter sp. C01]OOG52310.1 short-chain dehydrogenase [Rhodanobacter sp. C03]
MAESPSSRVKPAMFAELPALLASAPHRLLFLAGTVAVLLSMLWWALELTWMRFGLGGWPQPSIAPGWAHAMLIQYGLFPLFIFGFLLTVFPRWLNRPALPRGRYVPVAGCVFGGYVLANVGLLDLPWLLKLGFIVMLAGYVIGFWTLATVLHASGERDNHARSCLLAVGLGTLGLLAFLVSLFGGPFECATLAIRLGTFGLLLPIFFTVTHRMLPFFSGNVAADYRVIRPRWSLPVVWVLLLVHALLDWRNALGWLWLTDVPLALVFAWHALAWQPWKAMRPGLLAVLHLAFAWLPLAFVLYALQDVIYAASGHLLLGRAPLHALAIGYFGSMLVAMVTRVTQGHSGRPLQMGAVAWLCFGLLQIVVLLRIRAELGGDMYLWLVVAAYGWLLAFLPWVLRSAWIYLTPRVDNKPG